MKLFRLFALTVVLLAATFSSAQDYSHLTALRQQAARGDANSQYWLGRYYADLEIFMSSDNEASKRAPDHAKAVSWLTKSAAQGNVDAMEFLGRMYEDGEDLPENDSMAAVWYRAACDIHYGAGGLGCADLARLYLEGRGVPQDVVEAYKYAVVADQGSESEVNKIEAHMTASQLVEAQGRIEEWRRAHLRS